MSVSLTSATPKTDPATLMAKACAVERARLSKPTTVNTVRAKGAPPLPWAVQRKFAFGVTEAENDKLRSQFSIRVRGSGGLTLTRDALKLIACLQRETGAVISDLGSGELFSALEFISRRLDGWGEGKPPDVEKFVLVRAYGDGPEMNMYTLGMAKFGLLDLWVERVSTSPTRFLWNAPGRCPLASRRPVARKGKDASCGIGGFQSHARHQRGRSKR